jgi:hypothetical protein
MEAVLIDTSVLIGRFRREPLDGISISILR